MVRKVAHHFRALAPINRKKKKKYKQTNKIILEFYSMGLGVDTQCTGLYMCQICPSLGPRVSGLPILNEYKLHMWAMIVTLYFSYSIAPRLIISLQKAYFQDLKYMGIY